MTDPIDAACPDDPSSPGRTTPKAVALATIIACGDARVPPLACGEARSATAMDCNEPSHRRAKDPTLAACCRRFSEGESSPPR